MDIVVPGQSKVKLKIHLVITTGALLHASKPETPRFSPINGPMLHDLDSDSQLH